MSKTWTRIWAIVLIAIAALVLFVGARALWPPYRTEFLRGDGSITDGGFWSYPRYTVTFPRIQVRKFARYSFHVRGLPQSPMNFHLRVIDPEEKETDATTTLHSDWILTVSFRDDQNHEIKTVSAPLSRWNVAHTGNQAELWHESLRDISFKTRQAYLMEIAITGPGLEKAGDLLEPQLTGGGNELR